MGIEQKVTTDLTFANGVLVPAGTIINVDTAAHGITDDNSPNLADVGEALVNVPVAVAPIGPTGPNPTMPQQIPPGAFQTSAGYAVPGGALLVAEGSGAAANAGTIDDQGDGETPMRHAAEGTGDATTAALAGNAPTALNADERAELEAFRAAQRGERSSDGDDGFNADSVIDGTVPDVAGRLDGLTREQLLAVKDAEEDREQPRSGVHNAVGAAIAKLDAADETVDED